MKKQVHCIYEGQVQGVGFRFTAVNIANGLKIGGWIMNLPDGKVELLAEGEEEKLQDFFGRINKYFGNYITNSDIDWKEASGSFDSFEVRF